MNFEHLPIEQQNRVIDGPNWFRWHEARRENIGLLESWLNGVRDVNEWSPNGDNILHILFSVYARLNEGTLASDSVIYYAKKWIDKGVEIQKQNKQGETPMHCFFRYALEVNTSRIFGDNNQPEDLFYKILDDWDLDFSIKDNQGNSILTTAINCMTQNIENSKANLEDRQKIHSDYLDEYAFNHNAKVAKYSKMVDTLLNDPSATADVLEDTIKAMAPEDLFYNKVKLALVNQAAFDFKRHGVTMQSDLIKESVIELRNMFSASKDSMEFTTKIQAYCKKKYPSLPDNSHRDIAIKAQKVYAQAETKVSNAKELMNIFQLFWDFIQRIVGSGKDVKSTFFRQAVVQLNVNIESTCDTGPKV